MFVTKNAVKEFMIEPINNNYVQRNDVKSDILSPFFFMCHIRFVLSQKNYLWLLILQIYSLF
jgi:hypothetical protein